VAKGGEVLLVSIREVERGSVEAWCDNALAILDSLRRQAEKAPFRIPAETLCALEAIVHDWRADACSGRTPQPRAYEPDELRQLILYWFNVTKLTESERDRLGIEFTPPEGRAFADALADAVGEVLFASDELREFAERLAAAWQECQPAFVASRASSH
jgi:hypothetical protein